MTIILHWIERMTDRRAATILVIDDDELVRMPMVMELQDEGYEVLEASSGPEALDVLKANAQVSVAVVDLNMPALGGMALMTVMQVDWPKIAVLATSGADPKEPLPAGVLFLPKPHLPGQLLAAVEVSLLTEEFGLK